MQAWPFVSQQTPDIHVEYIVIGPYFTPYLTGERHVTFSFL